MKYNYVTLYEKNVAFYVAHPTAKRAIKLGNFFLTWLFFVAYAVLWICVLILEDYTPKLFAKLFFVPLLALLLVTVIRWMVERPRPYHEDGANITPLIDKPKSSKKSFPSRHLASANVIALTVWSIYPVAGIFLFLASIVLGYIRFAAGLHYPSDLIAGEVLGSLVGLLAFIL